MRLPTPRSSGRRWRWPGRAGVGVLAVLVWEGVSRGDDDMTAAFGDGARSLGVRVDQVLTL